MGNWSKVAAGVAALALIGAVGVPFIANDPAQANADAIENLKTQVTTVDGKIDALDTSCELVVPENTKIDEIHTEMFEADSYEAYGETLALDEIDSKDFKKAVVDAINDELENENEDARIESYRDIDEIKVVDIDSSITGRRGRGDDVEVDLELKVYYHTEGDEDEEGRARISTTLIAKDAANDDDEDRDDAEIESYNSGDITVERIYE